MPALRTLIILAAAGFCAAPLAAQDAAETAIILSGTGQGTGKASRSLGGSITRSMGNAANAINATNRARAQTPRSYRPQARRSRRGGGGSGFAIALPADVDPLETTDAPSYALENGATIRVSGGLRRPVEPGDLAAPK